MSGKFMMNGIEYLGGGSGGSGGNVDDVLVNGVSVVNEDKEAEIVSYKEVTQAEYEALPDTKLTDGIAYFIKDSTEAEGFPPLIYSTSEREVGVWIDGKPLYEKTYISHSTSVNTDITFDISSLNIDTVVYIGGIYDRFVNNKHYWQEWNMAEGTNNYAMARIDSDDGHGINGTLRGYIKYEGTTEQHFTIRYTKTTDTAGSGIWAGNGAMAHHYSTDEVIVGTWIDGKPLYERVFETNYIPVQNDWVNTGIDATGMDKIISFIGHCYGTGYMFLTSFDEVQLYNNMVRITCGPNGVGRTYNLSILRYTKTTD